VEKLICLLESLSIQKTEEKKRNKGGRSQEIETSRIQGYVRKVQDSSLPCAMGKK